VLAYCYKWNLFVSFCTKYKELPTSRAGKFCAFTFFSFCTFFYQTNRKTEQNILPNENITWLPKVTTPIIYNKKGQ